MRIGTHCRLVNAIDSTKTILGDIRTFNKDEWVVRYPQIREEDSPSTPRPSMRRSLSFADDPTSQTPVILGMTRSLTLASIPDAQEADTEDKQEDDSSRLIPPSEFQVLRLDLKLGSSSANSASSLVSQLEKSSIAHLLDDRLRSSMEHIDKLRLRVEDTSSKVLVTGDLNAGKSTLVNALLRREVMPVDQQPFTTAFCEVLDATANSGVEEVHIVKDGQVYDLQDKSTYECASIEVLESIVETKGPEQLIKVYISDKKSLLSNDDGTVSISLIDAPGLNRDSLKTTALFARQEEIDVVVFVVSAENHFTLSAKEFLWTASNEKAYLFIVVNKYDMIRNKEKCRRLVLEQIRGLSPRTYEDAADLVHFVDSAAASADPNHPEAFEDMEKALKTFVLIKREKSKLQPVETFLKNLLSDIDLLAAANAIVADSELRQAQEELAQVKPVLEKMKGGREKLEEGLESIEEDTVSDASQRARALLSTALERVGQGKLGVPSTGTLDMPTYPGLLGVWEYARAVRNTLLTSLDMSVNLAEDEARLLTSQGVSQVRELGEKHLPEGVERSRRVFMPEAMFSLVRRSKSGMKAERRRSMHGHGNGMVVAGGAVGLGIGLAGRPDMQETTILDLFDVGHQFWVHFGDASSKEEEENSSAPTALGLVSVGVGALTMVGGQAIGVRGVIEGVVRLSDLLGNETARKWAAPVIGAVGLGAVVYVVLELPSSIPKTIGRRIRSSVLSDGEERGEWEKKHAERIGRETRKVLRLASWDLRERFRGAMEERGREVRNAEEGEKRATRAKEWFGEVEKRVDDIRTHGNLMKEHQPPRIET